MPQSGDSNRGLKRFLASHEKEFSCEPIEFKVKARLFSREVSKKGKGKAPPQTEWWSVITCGREAPSACQARVYMCLYVFICVSCFRGKLLGMGNFSQVREK